MPIVVMSASEDPSLGRAALDAGASVFLSKTEAARSILSILNNLLRVPNAS
jgi:DNA-binding NarL/FixJ family response regulator